jgi:hypothetical protein
VLSKHCPTVARNYHGTNASERQPIVIWSTGAGENARRMSRFTHHSQFQVPRWPREPSNSPGKAQQVEYRQLMNNDNAKEELQAIPFGLSFQFWCRKRNTKLRKNLSASPECFLNFKFSSAVGTERNEARVVPLMREDIEESHMLFPITWIPLSDWSGMQIWVRLRRGSSRTSPLASRMRARNVCQWSVLNVSKMYFTTF